MRRQKTLLRHLRRQRDLTLDEVAAATKIDDSTLSRAERGLIPLTDENLKKLARYFRVPATDLLKEPLLQRPEVA